MIDTAAIRRAMHGPSGQQHSVEFEMHCVLTCPAMCGIAEPEIGLPYRAVFLAHYDQHFDSFRASVIGIDENKDRESDPDWRADQMPNSVKTELEEMISKALNEQAQIDETEAA